MSKNVIENKAMLWQKKQDQSTATHWRKYE